MEPHEAVLTTLLDHEVTFCAVGEGAREAEERISLRTGARIAPPAEADFALALGGDSGGRLRELKRGTLEEPAEGATAVWAVRRLSDHGHLTLALSGPGVFGERTVRIEGLTASEVEAILLFRSDYPRGVDAYLVDGRGMMIGLPRSTRLRVVP
jgi:alpha-D-ribose 1-methylphosphonate 5-triphosphate synthase subunit PhnH